MSRLTETDYGFKWDNVLIERAAEDHGGHLLTIRTPRDSVQIWITKSGLIRTPYHTAYVLGPDE